MSWQPSSDARTASRRAALLERARDFFSTRGVLAVDTPALAHATASDPNVDSLSVRSSLSDRPLYLATSPESAMKRLLAAGYPDIYSICRVFRDAELGRRHELEFTMIEWYRHDYSLDEMTAETCALIAAVLDRPTLEQTVDRVEYRQVFDEETGLDPLHVAVADLADAAEADDRLRAALGDEPDAWLDLVFATRVAPAFDPARITVVRHYPASQAALSRLCPNNPQLAERFEVFYAGLELANGYVELTDAHEQRRRIEADLATRRAAGREAVPVDESLLAALEHGLPECAGVAVGFERLQMIYDATEDIADVIPFTLRNRDA